MYILKRSKQTQKIEHINRLKRLDLVPGNRGNEHKNKRLNAQND